MLEAVTFDFWQTILREPLGEMRARQVEAFARILGDAGSAVRRNFWIASSSEANRAITARSRPLCDIFSRWHWDSLKCRMESTRF